MKGSVDAVVALGSNLGDSEKVIAWAFDKLSTLSMTPLRQSSLWRTEPEQCPEGSPPFLNAVALLSVSVDMTPERLLSILKQWEIESGRLPKRVMNEARVLDLDLISFGQEFRSGPDLTLPHPRAHTREFVLGPLAEVQPGYVIPGQTRNVSELLRMLRQPGNERL
ncbi:MAG: 2-amino-4-hydroxy-6-hydroxymethyldihydropteridine diphosphokinase [Verrucomicrobia bacterium]|nr:2-amino-4-hydroxy-6-hydroxymethyldihydropteridine diphosphokinase [Verrucomicrobiota bacterium]